MITLSTLASPIGPLTLAVRGRCVCALHFGDRRQALGRVVARWYSGRPIATGGDPGAAGEALQAYFAGDLRALDRIEVELHGTPFQMRVWEALRGVGPGTTASYAAIARAIGAPSAVRAVGAANGANPVAIIVPCHRIIGSNGTLTGYGGGLDRKRWLLRHEEGARGLGF